MDWILLCNDSTEASGTDATPWFSWRLAGTEIPVSWRVQIFDHTNTVLWDTETTVPAGTYLIYDGQPLASMTRYFWQVHAHMNGYVVKSPVCSFLTGVLHISDWNGAKWIEAAPEISSPFFKRSFTLTESQAQNSVISICGLGLYELYCNGTKVSEDFLTPAQTDYAPVQYRNLQYPFSGETRKSAFYQTYDLSGYLHAGVNTITVLLGNGFYRQRVRLVEGAFDYGNLSLLCCICCLEKTIISDETWLVTQSPLLHNNLFIGEVFDARLMPNDAYSATKSDTAWTSAICCPWKQTTLRPQMCPPDTIQQRIQPKLLPNSIYDAGTNLSGIVQLTCHGTRGTQVHLYFAEQLMDNELDYTSTCGYSDADKVQIQHDVYILSGNGIEQYRSHFVRHGFRYIKLVAEDATILDLTVLRTGMALTPAASLETSIPEVDLLFRAGMDSLRGNLSCGILSDCPHRERLGYTGDGQLSADALMTLYDAHAFYRKWIQDLIDAQNLKTGFIPHTAPFCGGGGGPAWGCAIAIVPWLNYIHYGDLETLRTAIASIELWLDYLAAHTDSNGLVCREESGGWCLGDWVFPSDRPWSEPHTEQPLKPEFVNTCYYAYCLQIYLRSCHALGLQPKEIYTNALIAATNNLNHIYFRNGGYLDGVQGADAFALMSQIVPQDQVDTVRQHLISYYESRGCVPDTGMFGTMHVLEELCQAGRRDLAWQIICRKDYPGLLHLLVQHNYTTMGETWEGSGSQSHIAFTSVAAWLMRWLAGIRIADNTEHGQQIEIDPFFPPEMRSLFAKMNTPAGIVQVSWVRNNEYIRLTVITPVGLGIKFILPYEDITQRQMLANTVEYTFTFRMPI